MLLIILALFWVALLAPMAVRRLRDGGTERSIESFHAEHEVLSRQEYAVAPAHRLGRARRAREPGRANRARLAPDGRSRRRHLPVARDRAARGTSGAEDYDYDATRGPPPPVNRYAAAYSSVPRAEEYERRPAPALRARRSARAQRRLIFTSLGAAVVVMTGAAFALSSSLVVDVAIVAWVALVGFVSLALYAVSQGYLDESSLGLRRRSRPLATVEPFRREAEAAYADDDEFDYDESPDASWRRGSSRYALG